ncbi:hypothetical protein PsorP6_005006 [Peronosclerospora sorghi]|uniref:Uncharacterized protein n=1 Tax=Peronosclerospora sorghi TaxID=230839 RepID=A0ACC0W4A2_9STRA|nr:hypothetical protein PsorP6_005006 [Peronosclerospora sorghi]
MGFTSPISLLCLLILYLAHETKGIVHQWPSLKLHFILKRNSMRLFGHRDFHVYAEPVVSSDGRHVLYNGYVEFTEPSFHIRYSLVDGIAYATLTTGHDPPSSHCLEKNVVPPLHHMIAGLNHAIPIAHGNVGGVPIECSIGNLLKVTVQGLQLAICAAGAAGVHVYDSDMEFRITYMNESLHITAPKLTTTQDCQRLVQPSHVTPLTVALLTGTDLSPREPRSAIKSNVSLDATTCTCKSRPRPCLFVHGLGVDYAKDKLQDAFPEYWGNLSANAPCCTDFKYMIWNSMATSWMKEKSRVPRGRWWKVDSNLLAGQRQSITTGHAPHNKALDASWTTACLMVHGYVLR